MYDYLEGRFVKLIRKRCNIAVDLIVYAMPLLRNHAILVYTYWHWWKHECLYHDLPPVNITPQISLCWISPKTALLNIIPLSQSLENSQSIPVIRVHHRAAPNHLLAQRMDKYFNKSLHNFCIKPHIWHEYFQVLFIKIGSSELRLTLHHERRLDLTMQCYQSAIVPPWFTSIGTCTKMYRKWTLQQNKSC